MLSLFGKAFEFEALYKKENLDPDSIVMRRKKERLNPY